MKMDITKMDITKVVEEIVMQAKETREEFIIETIHPYCEDILQIKINKEELKQILLNGIQKRQSCEDCRICNKWDECPCGKEGHKNGTSIGYSIGECKEYEPCGDCISREKAVKIVLPYVDGDLIADELKHLSPVTPQPKIGKWLDCYKEMPIFNAGGFTETKHVGWTCSCCGENHFWIKSDYCPNCGAKMEVLNEKE
jgi:hypothetical protein